MELNESQKKVQTMEAPTIEEYKEYAKELISACNKYHQDYLMYVQNDGFGHNEDTRYHKQIYWNRNCDGFNTGEGSGSCPCGKLWSWDDDDFDPTDTEDFNIHSVRPYGELRYCN